MSEKFRIKYFIDLLKIPSDKREEAAKQMLLALSMLEFAVGNELALKSKQRLWWKDDGVRHIDVKIREAKP